MEESKSSALTTRRYPCIYNVVILSQNERLVKVEMENSCRLSKKTDILQKITHKYAFTKRRKMGKGRLT